MGTSIEGVTAGIDWLTCTLPIEAELSAEFHAKALNYLQYIARQGYELKERSMLGYSGWSCGNCFVGVRNTDYMVQWTGFHADSGFDAVYRPDMHVSRIDVQITAKYEETDNNVARHAYADAKRGNEVLPATRRRKLFIIIGSDGGDTFYLGSPTSDQRGRIYNKEVQSEDPFYTRCWRYEVVFRNNHATAISAHIRAGMADRASTCAGIAAKWFSSRGVDTSWLEDTDLRPLPLVRSLPTDIERQMHWLTSQVKPTVTRLCERGFRDIVLASLGLSSDI